MKKVGIQNIRELVNSKSVLTAEQQEQFSKNMSALTFRYKVSSTETATKGNGGILQIKQYGHYVSLLHYTLKLERYNGALTFTTTLYLTYGYMPCPPGS